MLVCLSFVNVYKNGGKVTNFIAHVREKSGWNVLKISLTFKVQENSEKMC